MIYNELNDNIIITVEVFNVVFSGHHEGGPTACSKNFKTPFFKRLESARCAGTV